MSDEILERVTSIEEALKLLIKAMLKNSHGYLYASTLTKDENKYLNDFVGIEKPQ